MKSYFSDQRLTENTIYCNRVRRAYTRDEARKLADSLLRAHDLIDDVHLHHAK